MVVLPLRLSKRSGHSPAAANAVLFKPREERNNPCPKGREAGMPSGSPQTE
jgi:hypothetical protein